MSPCSWCGCGSCQSRRFMGSALASRGSGADFNSSQSSHSPRPRGRAARLRVRGERLERPSPICMRRTECRGTIVRVKTLSRPSLAVATPEGVAGRAFLERDWSQPTGRRLRRRRRHARRAGGGRTSRRTGVRRRSSRRSSRERGLPAPAKLERGRNACPAGRASRPGRAVGAPTSVSPLCRPADSPTRAASAAAWTANRGTTGTPRG